MKKLSRRQFIRNSALSGLSLAAMNLPKSFFSMNNQFDLIIKGGSIIDGTGKKQFIADIGVKDGRIIEIGKLSPAYADKVINAAGLKVSPGFIDIHSHSDYALLINPEANNKIMQGVTLEISGQCGYTMAPLGGKDNELDKSLKYYRDELGLDVSWRSFPEFLQFYSQRKFSVNIGIMAGLGTIRDYVIGKIDRKAEPEEIISMQHEVLMAMNAGAIGLSTGLEYIPGSFASTDEIIQMCKAMPENKKLYATHMRNEDKTILEAIDEAIRIAKDSGSRLQISHLKACGKSNWYKTDEMLRKIEKAASEGMNIHADRYPYTAYATSLDAFFPLWAREGGSARFIQRLNDKTLNGKIKEFVVNKVNELDGQWNGILLIGVGSQEFKHYQGKTIQKIAEEKNMDCYEAAVRVIKETEDNNEIMGFGMDEETTEIILAHPRVMIGSDYSVHSIKPPLNKEMAHPRAYGTFPRVIGKYVRDRKICPLEDMIKKMTSMPASKLNLADRGVIEKNKIADLVVFDYDKIQDKATYSDPHQFPEGIPFVIVNGSIVVENGRHTGALPGKLIKT